MTKKWNRCLFFRSCYIEMLCYERLHFLQQNHTKNGCSAHKQRWSPIPPIQSMCTDMYYSTHNFITFGAAATATIRFITAKNVPNAIASPSPNSNVCITIRVTRLEHSKQHADSFHIIFHDLLFFSTVVNSIFSTFLDLNMKNGRCLLPSQMRI